MIWFVHLMALLFCFPLLLVTIPMHLILNAVKKKGQ